MTEIKEFEQDDPLELVGVGYPMSGEESDRDLALCLIEEYALAGFAASEIFGLFTSSAYGLPHAILTRRGPEFVHELIRQVFGGQQ